ncbi:hypothetical protein HPP92_027110, partial [Vanilla planifolia]
MDHLEVNGVLQLNRHVVLAQMSFNRNIDGNNSKHLRLVHYDKICIPSRESMKIGFSEKMANKVTIPIDIDYNKETIE